MGMNIRPFDWRDLPALHRYRHQCLYLDSVRLLTQGPQFFPMRAVLSYFASAAGVFTFRGSENGNSNQTLIGQVVHKMGNRSARLGFLAPDTATSSPELPAMVERMQVEIGERGAYHLLAEVEEENEAFESLREAGFAIYARQRIWQLTGEPHGDAVDTPWKGARSQDSIAVRSLYCNLVPNLVQQIEPPPANRPSGVIYREGDELLAYVEFKYGPVGIWAQPFVHPDLKDVTCRLVNLLANLPNRRSRPVYLCVRSYQSWLETALEDLGAEVGPRQAVMVKRLVVPIKESRSLSVPALERNQREASAPMTHSKSG